ncbi:F-box domain-containing protein [Mycena kentingensis (nom. inval.)]|nr:F-box domain-containing protein [Mycena kentingensis (nom. inval.)]
MASDPLLGVPFEILEHILILSLPRDVAAFSGTCRTANELLMQRTEDQYLWRNLFLGLFDRPDSQQDFPWKEELISRMLAEKNASKFFAAQPGSCGIGRAERRHTLETLLTVARQIPAYDPDSDECRNIGWLHNVLSSSRILDADFETEECKYADRLRSYLALSLEDDKEQLAQLRSRSRCFVYDLRNYTSVNQWGPFLDKGAINWTHLYYILAIIISNLKEQEHPPTYMLPMPPCGLQATRAYSAPGRRSPEDWAGAEGTWHRYVSFMDYRDLFSFNFPGRHGSPHDPAFFEDSDFREATRLIELTMHLIPRSAMRVRFPRQRPARAHTPGLPHALLRRYLAQRVDHDGAPPAHSPRTSIQDGTPQWSSEGVQLGNVGSAMGIAGIWSAFGHGIDDPAGPFWAWKVSD